ncbi:S-dihydroxybenzoyltransferase [Drechslerella dactyloides]|uniref:S-dihydroxybenzoyltransferase n=1 Tax=Drechslerella dactyloides TaxID=74499 RepID=A0AAD6IRF2_DREDA|nr:S-dihydroxybenzoyltransferase [Drechslerella dactyloides]
MSTLSTAFSPTPSAPAVIIPATAKTYTYAELGAQIRTFQSFLASVGITTGSAVSISLVNGLEFIVSFLAATHQRAIAAPLNPAYKQAEFEFYIDDIKSALLVVPKGAASQNSEAVRAARKYNAGIAEVWVDARGDVKVELVEKGKLGLAAPLATAQDQDVALVLHTSGTTGRPKAVPLTHKNLTTTMRNIKATYQLTPADRAYLVMPLFHVHGLLAGFLAPLHSGGSVVVPPRFSAQAFWPEFVRFKANWYTAVPSMNSILLKSPPPNPLPYIRFIRSCSSPLAPATFHQIERTFGAPVLEAYAMTEAAHQMTSNPLPPAKRKPGSVGLGQGVDVRILDDNGDEVAQGKEGEICIEGENVTNGYLNNPAANASSFTKTGYFRTGDQGKKDEDGYVIITGRIKELINRGGEKISPIEIDSAMLAHPAVAEAVSFGMDDELMGQEPAAAVVFKEGKDVDVEELKKFLSDRLAKFKIPKRIFVTKHMPKTATGKIQRRIVAETMFREAKQQGRAKL